MTSLGWKLYHIWSVAWFLNPEDEKRRLLEFLKRCVEEQKTFPQGQQLFLSPEFEPESEDELTDILQLTNSVDNFIGVWQQYSAGKKLLHQFGERLTTVSKSG